MSDIRDRYAKQFGIPPDRIVVSKTLMCRLIGTTPKTIDSWRRESPPFPALLQGQQRPSKQEWVYDLQEVVEWCGERGFRKGIEVGSKKVFIGGRPGGEPGAGPGPLGDVDDGEISEDEAKRRIKNVQWRRELMALEREQGQLIYLDQAETMVAQVVGQVSEQLLTMMGELVARPKRAK